MANSLAGPVSAFPNGVSSYGIPQIGNDNLIPSSTGQYFFVGGSPLGSTPSYEPSITVALGKCVASRGDVIIVEPGYRETITTAAGIDLNKAGVSLIGMGNRVNRPQITMGATAATFAISATGVLMRNFNFTCSVDEVVSIMTISGGGATLDAVDYSETATFQAIQFALVTGTGVTIQNGTYYQATAAATAAQWISLSGADRARILNNIFQLTMANSASSAAIGSIATAPVNITITGNTIYLIGGTTIASAILLVASTTGMVTYNNVGSTATSQLGTIALASCYGAQNFSTNAVNKNGILDPIADT